MSETGKGPGAPGRSSLGTSVLKGIGGIVAAVVTAVLIAVLVPMFTGGDEPPPPEPGGSSSTQPPPSLPTTIDQPSTVAKLYTNKDSGPAGTRVRLSGAGFAPEEDITLLFHVDVVGHTQADGEGEFSEVSVEVPEDWQFTGQFAFIATGESSLKAARREFRVT
jgi:hypothetical protein